MSPASACRRVSEHVLGSGLRAVGATTSRPNSSIATFAMCGQAHLGADRRRKPLDELAPKSEILVNIGCLFTGIVSIPRRQYHDD
jgi:hypothetical protein